MECLIKIDNEVGESPTWCIREKSLYWLDIPRQEIHRYIPSTKSHSFLPLDQLIAAINMTEKGRFICAGKEGFFFFDWHKKELIPLHHPEKDRPLNRFNDGKCDREGRFWAGTMHDTEFEKDTGALYRLDKDLQSHRTEKNIRCSNGLGFSPDNRKMYYAESFAYTIHVYDFEVSTGKIINKGTFAKIEKGFPDGLTVDSEGNVWVAINGEGKIACYYPKGIKIEEIKMEVPRPTSLCFGGENLDMLYITSTRSLMSKDDLEKYTLSGSLFVHKSPIKGLPQPLFKE